MLNRQIAKTLESKSHYAFFFQYRCTPMNLTSLNAMKSMWERGFGDLNISFAVVSNSDSAEQVRTNA